MSRLQNLLIIKLNYVTLAKRESKKKDFKDKKLKHIVKDYLED